MRLRSRAAGIWAGILITGLLATQVQAQMVSACQPSPRIHYPNYTDSTPGWSATETVANVKNQLVTGDIDGDGYDELIALPKGQNRVDVWRWSYTVWTPMVKFPSDLITQTLPGGTATQIHLADVDGDGRKEIVIYVVGPGSTNDQEQTYKFDPMTYAWTLLNVYASGKADLQSYWFKAKPGDKQDTRFRLAATFMDIRRFQNGTWVSVPGNGTSIDRSSIAQCATGRCVAFTDLDGNGYADLVWLATDASIRFNSTPPSGQYFTTSPKISSVRASTPQDQHVLNSWQMGDIDGDGKDELIFFTPTQLAAYYFDPAKSDFVAYTDTNRLLGNGVNPTDLAVDGSLVIAPRALQGYVNGVAALGKNTFLYQFLNNGGIHSVKDLWILDGGFAPNNQLDHTGYAGYLNFAVEQGGSVMLTRGPNGILSEVENQNSATGTIFLDSNTYSNSGYPAFSGTPQTIAYAYISAHGTGNNPDVRSLYVDPATPWPAVLLKVETMSVPPAPSGIATTDWTAAFHAVQDQITAEITAVQTVNQIYQITGQFLTNTYLVKDASLAQITDVLNIPGQPDVSSEALGYVTAAVNGLGSLLYAVNGAFVLANLPEDFDRITNNIGAAGGLVGLVGAITGDTATYTAESAPDLSTGQFNLKQALDNFDLAAATANTCHQLSTLGAWDQIKPLADGVTSGTIPLDLQTQQDLLQASQAVFQRSVWQTLAPTVWNLAPSLAGITLSGTIGPYGGNPTSYPPSYVRTATCHGASNSFTVAMVLENAATNNFPNITALHALFDPPPVGLGATPDSVALQQDDWKFPLIPTLGVVPFDLNANLAVVACPNGISATSDTQPSPLLRRRVPSDSAGMQAVADLKELRAEVQAKLQDTKLAKLLAMDLNVAAGRLEHALQFQQTPKETLRLLNGVLTRLQFHATQSGADSDVSNAGVVKAVAIRDLLLKIERPESPASAQ